MSWDNLYSDNEDAAPKIKVGVFTHTAFIETLYLRYLPHCGDYLQAGRNQKHLAWQIEAVIFLRNDYQEWDIVAITHTSPLLEPTKDFYYEKQESIQKERANRKREIRTDRDRFRNPSEAWQRRKGLYERVEAGESVKTIAEAEGMTLQRVKVLSGDWRRLLTRLEGYKEHIVDGKQFDAAELKEQAAEDDREGTKKFVESLRQMGTPEWKALWETPDPP